jgi:hypothetical protein
MNPMYQCPRYIDCSAPLCPLDPDWRTRIHRSGDRVCFYLREAVKAGAPERFKGGADAPIYLAATDMLAQSTTFVSDLRKRLKDAASSGSRVEKGYRLNAGVEGSFAATAL